MGEYAPWLDEPAQLPRDGGNLPIHLSTIRHWPSQDSMPLDAEASSRQARRSSVGGDPDSSGASSSSSSMIAAEGPERAAEQASADPQVRYLADRQLLNDLLVRWDANELRRAVQLGIRTLVPMLAAQGRADDIRDVCNAVNRRRVFLAKQDSVDFDACWRAHIGPRPGDADSSASSSSSSSEPVDPAEPVSDSPDAGGGFEGDEFDDLAEARDDESPDRPIEYLGSLTPPRIRPPDRGNEDWAQRRLEEMRSNLGVWMTDVQKKAGTHFNPLTAGHAKAVANRVSTVLMQKQSEAATSEYSAEYRDAMTLVDPEQQAKCTPQRFRDVQAFVQKCLADGGADSLSMAVRLTALVLVPVLVMKKQHEAADDQIQELRDRADAMQDGDRALVGFTIKRLSPDQPSFSEALALLSRVTDAPMRVIVLRMLLDQQWSTTHEELSLRLQLVESLTSGAESDLPSARRELHRAAKLAMQATNDDSQWRNVARCLEAGAALGLREGDLPRADRQRHIDAWRLASAAKKMRERRGEAPPNKSVALHSTLTARIGQVEVRVQQSLARRENSRNYVQAQLTAWAVEAERVPT